MGKRNIINIIISGRYKSYPFEFRMPKSLRKKPKQLDAYVDGLVEGAASMLDRIEHESSLLNTPEAWEEAVIVERNKQLERGYDLQHDLRHGPEHLLEWAERYARMGKLIQSVAMMRALGDMLKSPEMYDK